MKSLILVVGILLLTTIGPMNPNVILHGEMMVLKKKTFVKVQEDPIITLDQTTIRAINLMEPNDDDIDRNTWLTNWWWLVQVLYNKDKIVQSTVEKIRTEELQQTPIQKNVRKLENLFHLRDQEG